jgi:hypothetical protein
VADSDGYWKTFTSRVDNPLVLLNWLPVWEQYFKRPILATRISTGLTRCLESSKRDHKFLILIKLINDLCVNHNHKMQPFSKKEVVQLNYNVGTLLRITYSIDATGMEKNIFTIDFIQNDIKII